MFHNCYEVIWAHKENSVYKQAWWLRQVIPATLTAETGILQIWAD